MTPNTLIIRTAGTNCDRELAYAFELAGAATQTLHLNELIDHPDRLETFDIVGFPGGFSYGDDISAGRIFANRLRHHLYEPLLAAIDRGVPMIGICNGFQVLMKLGLLPDPHAGSQLATLADNTAGRFLDKWVPMQADNASTCIWTRSLEQFDLPIAHGEGRVALNDDTVLQQMRERGQIALRYAPDHNPNGSVDNIAGLCDPTGLVLGLMPHPERFVDPTHHPQWTRQNEQFLQAEAPGLRFFRNAVEHVKAATQTAV